MDDSSSASNGTAQFGAVGMESIDSRSPPPSDPVHISSESSSLEYVLTPPNHLQAPQPKVASAKAQSSSFVGGDNVPSGHSLQTAPTGDITMTGPTTDVPIPRTTTGNEARGRTSGGALRAVEEVQKSRSPVPINPY